jgi:acetyl-CoA carboxylase biotin carboxyl carrier protein
MLLRKRPDMVRMAPSNEKKMNESYIKKLIRLVEDSEIESLEISRWGRRVKIVGRSIGPSNGNRATPPVVRQVTPTPVQPETTAPEMPAEPSPTAEETGRLVAIKSPMVGTFYVAPSPEAPAYVSLNEKVTVGQVVCIVEAMKLMNEIESEIDGHVVEIKVENAQPVEFGQTLFLIDPSG